MAANIIALLVSLAAIILSVLDSRKAAQEQADNARRKARQSALDHAAASDPDGAVSDVLGMPDR